MNEDSALDPTETLSAEVGRRLRERRHELGQTLVQVAGAAGFSPAHLGEIETGKSLCSLPVLLRLCQALDYPVAEILPRLGGHRVRVGQLGSQATPEHLVSHNELDLRVHSVELSAGEEFGAELNGADAHVFVVKGACTVGISGQEASMSDGDSANIAMAQTLRLRASTATSALLVIGAGQSGTSKPSSV